MKWLAVLVLAMFLLASPRAEASVVTVTTDALGLATQVVFDESGLNESDEAAAPAAIFGFSTFFLSRFIPEIDTAKVFLLEPDSTPDHPIVSDFAEVRHTFQHADGITEVSMLFFSDVNEIPLSTFGFSCGRNCVVETGGFQDITELFPGNLPFRVLVRSDVPEPATLALLGMGLVALAGITWRRSMSPTGVPRQRPATSD